MKMYKLLVLLLCCTSFALHCQSWQWGKRGGSMDLLNTNGGLRQEEVFGLVTDSHKNIYTISNVGMNNLNIDGHVKTNFGDPTTLTDVALASFSCDGTYRWSKIFGGGGYDYLLPIQIDAQDNIYVAGNFATCEYDTSYPPRIDNDFILSQNPQNCSLAFISKFDNNGNLLWIKRPQQSTTSQQSAIIGLSTDALGNNFILAMLQPGTYADGLFTATVAGTYPIYLLKYDNNGNFISGTYLDMQLTGGSTNVKFSRNPSNGYFYFASTKDSSTDTAVIGGQTVSHAAFIWCFNDLGQFQWLKESSGPNYDTIFWYNFAFDPQNNIYISGYIAGLNYETFLGLTTSQLSNPPFVMKLNATADTVLWSTYPTKGGRQTGAIVLNGNEIGVTTTCSGSSYTWGTQTFAPGGTNQGTEVLFARLNKDTGACLGLTKIPGDIGYDDCGTALAVDASGDYILGGGFGHQLTFTTNTLLNVGQQSDFFVAKYSTSVCSLGTEDFKEEGLEMYPNPVENIVKVTTKENLRYAVYSVTGSLVKEGKIMEQQNNIDVSGLSSGSYILQTTNESGVIKKAKLLKK